MSCAKNQNMKSWQKFSSFLKIKFIDSSLECIMYPLCLCLATSCLGLDALRRDIPITQTCHLFTSSAGFLGEVSPVSGFLHTHSVWSNGVRWVGCRVFTLNGLLVNCILSLHRGIHNYSLTLNVDCVYWQDLSCQWWPMPNLSPNGLNLFIGLHKGFRPNLCSHIAKGYN